MFTWSLSPACKDGVTLFLAVFALWNTWVHVGTMYCGNAWANIEQSVDGIFSVCLTLKIPNVYPNYSYI